MNAPWKKDHPPEGKKINRQSWQTRIVSHDFTRQKNRMFSRLTFLLRSVKRPLPVLLAAWSLLVMTAAAQGGFSATVSWDPSTSTNVAGYKIQYGTSSNNKTNIIFADAATTSLEISNFNAGTTYFFAVKTVDSSGNLSAFSPEAYFSAPAAPKLFTKTWSDESGSFLEVTTGLNLSQIGRAHV